jgi:hypothetical protein
MLILSIIIFGLAVVRSVVPFAKKEVYTSLADFIGNALVFLPMLICYVWFLNQFVSLNN